MDFSASILIYLALLFIVLTLGVIAAAMFISYQKNKFREKKNKVKTLIDLTISEHLMASMDGDENYRVSEELKALMKKKIHRKLMIRELLTARKSFSGKAGESIQVLYELLGLQQHSLANLGSKQWHVKAKAIQQLSMMQQKESWKKIYKLTNHHNEHLRMEAQAGIIRLFGFDGLRFLEVIHYHLTEWEQINLLHLLKTVPVGQFKGMEKWLQSANTSVVIFALKLVATFRRYEMSGYVEDLQKHADASVSAQARKTISRLNLEDVTA